MASIHSPRTAVESQSETPTSTIWTRSRRNCRRNTVTLLCSDGRPLFVWSDPDQHRVVTQPPPTTEPLGESRKEESIHQRDGGRDPARGGLVSRRTGREEARRQRFRWLSSRSRSQIVPYCFMCTWEQDGAMGVLTLKQVVDSGRFNSGFDGVASASPGIDPTLREFRPNVDASLDCRLHVL